MASRELERIREAVLDQLHVYEADVLWDRKRVRVLIDEADTVPSIGMALLVGYELKMQVRSRGRVSIKRIA